MGLDALALGVLFAMMKYSLKLLLDVGYFGDPLGQRGKPGWMTPTLGAKRGAGLFEVLSFFLHSLVPLLVTVYS